jgi:hypothetical protein
VVLSEVAIIQTGSSQIANTAIPQNIANPNETSGIRAKAPIITKTITAKFPNTFIIDSKFRQGGVLHYVRHLLPVNSKYSEYRANYKRHINQ